MKKRKRSQPRKKRRTRPSRSAWRRVLDPKNPRRYAAWLRKLRNKNGAYAFRNEDGEVLYVGESHSKKLYGTITRHFQQWTGPTAGITTSAKYIECRVKVTRLGRTAVKLQNLWIRRYDPVMNTQGKVQDGDLAPDSAPVPF